MVQGSMSRRHFDALADMIYRARVIAGSSITSRAVINAIEADIEHMCEHENPGFDLERFRARSGNFAHTVSLIERT